MQLFEAFLPQIYKECVQPESVKEILEVLNTPMSFFPRCDGELPVHDQLAFAKAVCVGEKLYSHGEI